MACRQAHYGFPDSWRVIVLNVVVDQARVSCRCVEAFSQILKKDPHQHCTDGHANNRQTIACLRLVGNALSQWGSVRRHSEPRGKDATPDWNIGQAQIIWRIINIWRMLPLL